MLKEKYGHQLWKGGTLMTGFKLPGEQVHISHGPLWYTAAAFLILALLVMLIGPNFGPHWLTHLIASILVGLALLFAVVWLVVVLSLYNAPKLRRWRWREPRRWHEMQGVIMWEIWFCTGCYTQKRRCRFFYLKWIPPPHVRGAGEMLVLATSLFLGPKGADGTDETQVAQMTQKNSSQFLWFTCDRRGDDRPSLSLKLKVANAPGQIMLGLIL